MFGAGAHTWPTEFLPDIRKRLYDGIKGMTADRVFGSNWPDDWHLSHPPADRFITLFMPKFQVDQQDVTGGGKWNTAFDSTLLLKVFVRLESDAEGKSKNLLEDETNGVYILIQQVLTLLQTWDGPLQKSSQLQMFRRPMRIAPGFEIVPRGFKNSRWCISNLNFEVSFVADLGVDFTGEPL